MRTIIDMSVNMAVHYDYLYSLMHECKIDTSVMFS